MTVIAAYVLDQRPYLVGDLLLTTEGLSDRAFELPTMAAAIGAIGNHHIKGMRQKLCIVAPYLAIAWTGYEENAVPFIGWLRQLGNILYGRLPDRKDVDA
jgi:hypothetical protein